MYNRIKKALPHLFLKIFFSASVIFAPSAARAEQNTLWSGMRTMLKPLGERAFGYRQGVPPDIRVVVALVIRSFLVIFSVIFFALIVYGGYTWMMAQGERDRVEKGMGILRNGIVGVVIIVAAWSIARFVLRAAVCSVSQNGNLCILFTNF